MSHKSKKAAPEATSEESVTTKSAESQEQPTTTPDRSTARDVPAVRGAEELTTEAQSITVTTKNMSPQKEQFHKAIAMSDKDLGIAIKTPTQRITKHVGDALAHEEEAKKLRREAQQEFERNIAYYYEAKQRLRNPGTAPTLTEATKGRRKRTRRTSVPQTGRHSTNGVVPIASSTRIAS